MTKKILPIAGYIVVKDYENNKLPSGFITAQEDDKTGNLAEVVECGRDLTGTVELFYFGDEFKMLKCPVKKGDIILFNKYAYTEVTIEGESYKLVQFKDIVAIIK